MPIYNWIAFGLLPASACPVPRLPYFPRDEGVCTAAPDAHLHICTIPCTCTRTLCSNLHCSSTERIYCRVSVRFSVFCTALHSAQCCTQTAQLQVRCIELFVQYESVQSTLQPVFHLLLYYTNRLFTNWHCSCFTLLCGGQPGQFFSRTGLEPRQLNNDGDSIDRDKLCNN